MRLRKIKNATEKLALYPEYIVFNPQEYYQKWRGLFNNNNPVHLEIGMGKGQFIRESALLNPAVNYIGCEISESVTLKAARRIQESRAGGNVKIVNKAAFQLSEIFAPGEISRIYLNFSDPWPKSRHEKRRLTSDAYLDIYKNILEIYGIIELKTDNESFFEYSLIQLNNHGFTFLEVDLNLHEQNEKHIICTEYEDKFIAVGQNIYYIKVKNEYKK